VRQACSGSALEERGIWPSKHMATSEISLPPLPHCPGWPRRKNAIEIDRLLLCKSTMRADCITISAWKWKACSRVGQPKAPRWIRGCLAVQSKTTLSLCHLHGTIPEGQYGAGTVTIWDQGTYDNLLTDQTVMEWHCSRPTGVCAVRQATPGPFRAHPHARQRTRP
jgi:hypothetical protein